MPSDCPCCDCQTCTNWPVAPVFYFRAAAMNSLYNQGDTVTTIIPDIGPTLSPTGTTGATFNKLGCASSLQFPNNPPTLYGYRGSSPLPASGSDMTIIFSTVRSNSCGWPINTHHAVHTALGFYGSQPGNPTIYGQELLFATHTYTTTGLGLEYNSIPGVNVAGAKSHAMESVRNEPFAARITGGPGGVTIDVFTSVRKYSLTASGGNIPVTVPLQYMTMGYMDGAGGYWSPIGHQFIGSIASIAVFDSSLSTAPDTYNPATPQSPFWKAVHCFFANLQN